MNIKEMIELLEQCPDKSKTVWIQHSDRRGSWNEYTKGDIEIVIKTHKNSSIKLGDIILE